jgi:type I restriction enzyme, S subunit
MQDWIIQKWWRKVKIWEILKIKHGWAFRWEYFSNEGEYIVLTPWNFIDTWGFKLRWDKDRFYTWTFPSEYLLRKDDVIIAMTEQMEWLLGSSAIIPDSQKYLHNQRLWLIIPGSEIYSMYAYYLFNTSYIRNKISASATWIKVRHTAPERIYGIDISLPSFELQQKIASVLSNYDHLIENNIRRIKILEQTAQEIYKEWFVHFRFPWYESVKMIDSGTDFWEIPEGWERKKVADVLMPIKRKGKLQTKEYLENWTIPIIDQGRDFIGGYSNNSEIAESTLLPMVIFWDHTRILKYIDFPFICGADGTQLLYPKTKELLPSYFYLAIKNVDLWNFHYARHFKFLKEQFITLPDTSTLNKFHNVIWENFKLVSELRDTNKNLITTRDLLLPKLISWEIDVSELEIV